jgi:choline dehydrogenase
VNGYRQEGFAPFDRNIHDGRRLSAARAYLHPVMGRSNLEVKTRAFVRGSCSRNRAVGVEYTHGRGVHRGWPARWSCAAAPSTPQTLQVSGVGNADELTKLGVDVVADVPGVGENLQDHLEVTIQYASTQPVSVAPYEVAQPPVGRAGVVAPARRDPGRRTTSRAAASSAATTRWPIRT